MFQFFTAGFRSGSSSMRNLLILCLVLTMAVFSCTSEKETLDPSPSKDLAFSADTIFFDTVFTDLQTATIRLKVYNPNDKAVRINSVAVSGVNGKYPFTFYINGRLGPNKVENVELQGKDSAYVLMSAKIDPRDDDLPFIVADSLVFEVEGRRQQKNVKILAYGQDAIYLRNTVLDCNTTWTADRPIILVDSVVVKKGCSLNIDEGTRVYGYNNAYMLIRGELIINGTKDKPVVFEGTRRESYYSDVPGQWLGIFIMDGGLGLVDNLLLKNAYRGIQVGEVGTKPESVPNAGLKITNSYIHNIVDYGILGVKGVASVLNCQFADCGESGFSGLQGGSYELWHNTFGMSGNNPFRRDGKFMLTFADNLPDSRTQTTYVGKLLVKAVNNLVSGSEKDEIAFGKQIEGASLTMDTLFFHNLLKSRQTGYLVNSTRNKGNQFLPSNFRFLSPLRYQFQPDTLLTENLYTESGLALDTVSPLNSGLLSSDDLRTLLSKDILGRERPVAAGKGVSPGAYQVFKP